MYTILLVEDEAMELLALKYAVNMSFPDTFEILEAADGATALSLCEKFHPSIIIVDINIPGLTGLELIQSVNNLGWGTRLLITTAYDKTDYIRRALEMGVVSYLLKPVDVKELKTAIERCLAQIEQSSRERAQVETLLQGIASARSYANEYLVQDLLSGHAPSEVLHNVCGWPENGSLQLSLVYWHSVENPDYDLFYEICYQTFHEDFSLLFSPYGQGSVVFLQSLKPLPLRALLLLLHISLEELLGKAGQGKIAGTNFYDTYEELFFAWKKLEGHASDQVSPLDLPALPMNALGSRHKRVLTRQKIFQRIRDGQIQSLTAMMKKFISSEETSWPGVSLFIEAFRQFDPTVNPRELFDLFLQENGSLRQFAGFMEEYRKSTENAGQTFPAAETYAETAMNYIQNHFQKDLTLTEVAEELGLSAPYFSSLFRQQTGKTFITYLNEVRILHSMELLKQGERDMQNIAAQCGYYNKKYFFQTFKRISGKTITQYLQGDHL